MSTVGVSTSRFGAGAAPVVALSVFDAVPAPTELMAETLWCRVVPAVSPVCVYVVAVEPVSATSSLQLEPSSENFYAIAR